MLGAYAVGKTSLVSRFVKGIYSDRYKTTVGVKIDRKDVHVGNAAVRMLLWDLHGEDEYQRVKAAYLRGAAGCLLVADGTRRSTLETAHRLGVWASGILGPVPFGLVINKLDLERDWEFDMDEVERLGFHTSFVVTTSARLNTGVESAYAQLASRMLGA